MLLPRLAHLGVGLRRAVVGDRDGLHSPGGGALDHLGGVGQGVEGGVARVQMELDAPPLAREFLRAQLHRGGGYGHGLYDHVVIELVEVHAAAHDDAHAGLNLPGDGCVLAAGDELVDAHGAGVIRHVEAEDGGPALLYLAVVDGENLALDRDEAALERDRAHVDGLVPLAQGLAVEELAVLLRGLRLLGDGLRALGVYRDAQEAVLRAQRALERAYLRRGDGLRELRVHRHGQLGLGDIYGLDLGALEAACALAQGLAAGEDGQEGDAHLPTSLSMSSRSAAQSPSSGTLRTISPFLKSRPQPRPPATP